MKTKYTYVKVIQQYFGIWEDVSEYETNSLGTPKDYIQEKFASDTLRNTKQSLLKHDLKEYKLMGYPVRVIRRKELNN